MGNKTVLYNKHIELGAKMVEFGGWDMPVQYTSIIEEHKTVRNSAGFFDVSHMGQIFVSGKQAVDFLQSIVPQDIAKLMIQKAEYCQLTRDNGGLTDDLIIYHLDKELYLIIANAANVQKDFEWLTSKTKGFEVLLENKSNEFSMIALQGPNAGKIVKKLGLKEEEQPHFFTIKTFSLNGIEGYIARTGYTGEDGFEFIIKNEYALKLWDMIFEEGEEFKIKPVGLGARDTLRLEAALMLYGNDLNEDTTPIEAGLKWSVPADKKEDYTGKNVILSQIKNGVSKKLIGLEMTERAIPRHGYEIYFQGHKTGVVSSGGYSPTLDKNIAMGYVDTKDNIKLDETIEIMVRNKLYKAKVVKRPFVAKRYKIN